MRAVVQRVTQAEVSVGEEVVGAIGAGLCVLVGVTHDDTPGDAAKLHDVFRNLVENASHYSPEGATIDVTARRAGTDVEIAVLDRGPGIPPADLQRIFERFYRVDRSRTRDPGGTGLGLSIVKHLIELHQGRVHAANRQGGGAIVSVVLPIARSPIDRRSPDHPMPSPDRPITR